MTEQRKRTGRGHTVLTDENILELERRFKAGASVTEAIDGLMSEDSYYHHRKNNSEFAARMDIARDYIAEIAFGVVARRVIRGDVPVAQWWLERRDKKRFSSRSEVTGKDGEALVPTPILGGVSVQKDDDGDSNN